MVCKYCAEKSKYNSLLIEWFPWVYPENPNWTQKLWNIMLAHNTGHKAHGGEGQKCPKTRSHGLWMPQLKSKLKVHDRREFRKFRNKKHSHTATGLFINHVDKILTIFYPLPISPSLRSHRIFSISIWRNKPENPFQTMTSQKIADVIPPDSS